MNNSLSLSFSFNSNEIQVVGDLSNPLFVAAHVAQVLGFDKPDNAYRMLDEDEKYPHIVRGAYGEKEMICVNESGLYNLIFKSRKPEAKAFRKWVTSEVLPSIRKTGGYSLVTPEQNETTQLHYKMISVLEEVIRTQKEMMRMQMELVELKNAPKFRKMTEQEHEDVASLYKAGTSIEGICRELKRGKNAVYSSLKRQGLR
jgi:anti-repressor protein